MAINRRVQGLDRLNRQLRALPALQAREASRALEQGAGDIADAIHGAAPDAALKASVDFGPGAPPSGAILKGGPLTAAQEAKAAHRLMFSVWAGDDTAFWARWTEYGTAAHAIRPKRGSAVLRFDTASGPAFAQGVYHPGARAQPFFWPSVRARRRAAVARVVRASNRAAKLAAAVR